MDQALELQSHPTDQGSSEVPTWETLRYGYIRVFPSQSHRTGQGVSDKFIILTDSSSPVLSQSLRADQGSSDAIQAVVPERAADSVATPPHWLGKFRLALRLIAQTSPEKSQSHRADQRSSDDGVPSGRQLVSTEVAFHRTDQKRAPGGGAGM